MSGPPKQKRVQTGKKWPPAVKKPGRNADEAQTVGLAILRLRRGAGMTLRQLAAAAAPCTVASLTRYEQGRSLPRVAILWRIVAAMGATMVDLYRAQQAASEAGGKVEDGTLPPDTRTTLAPPPTTSHQATVQLAQECGKAVAHCCLAFMEMGARDWQQPRVGGNGADRAQPGRQAPGERREVASLRQDRPDA
ncbi:MAG TPA: helix-turn-helix transcriptional regulator [Terriglobia bacterium]|nr:helix-turn-helix transcriptional regulator [Terriglobia bacterium]